jgi:uncharacterized protein YjdB
VNVYTLHQGSYVAGFSAKSSNTNVATVSVQGVYLSVKGVNVGSADITITGNDGAVTQLRIRK